MTLTVRKSHHWHRQHRWLVLDFVTLQDSKTIN